MNVKNLGAARSYVYAELPRAGLGNMLLVWARALVFSRLHELPLMVSPWGVPRIGPYLRGERAKRLYWGYFRDQSPIGRIRKLVVFGLYPRIREPALAPLPAPREGRLYVFGEVPHWADYFAGLKDYRELIREALHAMLTPRTRRALARLDAPGIGLHVRMGDYRPLRPGDDFAKVGTTRTPLSYFRDVIEIVRKAHGSRLPVTVFSDGHDQELADLLSMPAVTRARPSSDIAELLNLARSRVVVCSAGSTFSYWSAFLSDAPVVLHPDHIHASVRSEALGATLYEGPPTSPDGSIPPLLAQNIRAIRWP